MKPLFPIALAALLLGLGSPTSARACSCAPLPEPKGAAEGADAVFIATVTSIDVHQINREVHLKVASAWKGAKCGELVLTTGLNDADCGFAFQEGKSYLVYAYGEPGKLATGLCTRTRPLSKADEDLAALGKPKTSCGQG
jgi:hypothetical protein